VPQPVVVYTAAGRLQADVIKGLLEAAGIPAHTSQEGAGAAYGLTVGPLGLVDVWVAEDRAAEARAVLDAMRRGELDSDDSPPMPGE
jgi:hypothetical protein